MKHFHIKEKEIFVLIQTIKNIYFMGYMKGKGKFLTCIHAYFSRNKTTIFLEKFMNKT